MARRREREPGRTRGAEDILSEVCPAVILDSPVSTWIADKEGTSIYQNEATRRLFGIERDEETVGRYNIFKDEVLIAAGFMPQIRKVFEEGGSTEVIVDYDFSKVKHVRPSRPTHKILRGFLFAIKDREGRVRNVVVQHEDWTERVRTETALETSEARYRQLVEDVSDWIWEVDLEGRYTYASPAVEHILGYTPEEVLGKTAFDLIAPRDREACREEFEEAVGERREIVRLLNLNLRKDGSECYLETSGRPVFDPKGTLVGYRGVDRDITSRVGAERALEEERKRFRALIENASDLITVMDADTTMTYVSPSVERVLGYKPEELIGKNALDYVHQDDLERGRQGMAVIATHEGELVTTEFRLRHKDGSWRTFEAFARSLLEDPAVRGIIVNHRDITTRKQAEAAVRESEERYRSLVQSAVDAVVGADSDGMIISWNKAAEAMFGYTEEEVTGKPAAILMPERYRAAHTEGLERMRTGGERRLIGTTTEFEGTRKDGAEFPLELSLTTWLTPRGRFYSAIIRDITERKRAEEVLQKTYEQLSTVIDTSPLAVITLDLEGKVTSWNPAAEKIFGWTAKEVLGKPMPIIPDDQLPVFHGHLQQLLEGDILSGVEVPHIRKDGTRIEISVSIAGLHDSTGATIGFMGMLADITERKRAAEALRESEGKYRQLVDMMNEGLARTDGNYVLTYVNQKFADMLGYRPEEMLGRSILDFVHPDARSLLGDQMERRKHGEAGSYELAWRAKDGRTVWTLASPKPVFDDAGNFAGSIAVLTDITERKKAEEAAQRKQQEVITLLNTLPGYVFFKDANSVYITANEVFAKAVGVPVSEIPGKTDYDLFPRELAEKYRADDRTLVEAGRPLEIGEEETIDGTRRLTVETRKVPLKDNRGNVIGLIGIALDVTERKKAQAALQKSEEKYRGLVETTDTGYLIVDTQGRVVDANAEYVRLTGRQSLDEILGHSVLEWTAPYDLERNEREVRKCAEKGFVRNLVIDYVSPEGRVTPIEINGTVIETADGPRILTLCRDITERTEAERRAKELEAHKREFYRKTIEAATEGKLVITERDEILDLAGPPIASWEIHSGKDLSLIRQGVREIACEAGMDEDRICDLVLATGEATTNAFKHAGGGTASLHRMGDSFIMMISDHGKGMEALALPAVALRRGYTTTTSLGMGYKAMLSIADKVYLATGPSGTTVAIEMSLRAPEISPALAALPDAWKT